MTQALSAARMIRTTNATIAFANLAAQFDGLDLHAVQGWLTSRSWAELVDLLIMRATCSAESPTLSALLR